jgi:hypothetical protein
MASALNTKINSYAIEKGFELASTYALPVPETGTAANSTASDWSTSGGSIVHEPTVGPLNGAGSWRFNSTVATGFSRIRNTNTSMISVVNDKNFTAGIWVKINKLPETGFTNAMPIAQIASANTAGFGFFATGTQSASPSQFSFATDNVSSPVVPSGVTLNLNEWYFLAVIQDATSTKYYINGVEALSLVRNLTTSATLFIIGSAVVPTNTATEMSMNASNFFIAPASTVTASDLLEIYNVGHQSNLEKKINTYAIEKGISFDHGYRLPPEETGTIAQSIVTNWNKTGRNPVSEPTVSPYNSNGSWKFQIDGNNGCRLRNENSGLVSTINDNNFSTGLWVMFPSLPSLGTDVRKFHIVTPEETLGFSFGITGNSGSNNFVFGISTIPDVITGTTIQANTWYYLALRRTSNTWTAYLNGSLVLTKTHSSSSSTAEYSIFGDTSTAYSMTYNLSNFYMAPFATIDANAITEIWNTTQPISVNITKSPATASALMQEPTIVIVANDNVQVTTSIVASAEFRQNVVVSAIKNINNVVTEVLEASAIIGDNIIVSTGSNESYSSEPLTATALLVDPIIAVNPMIASATMPGGSANVQANYYSLVKALNPYLYIYDGKSTTTTNSGYQTGTFTKDLNLRTLQDLGNPLNLIAEGKSWLGPAGSSDGKFTFTTATIAESFNELVSNGTFAWESWVKLPFMPNGLSDPTFFLVRGPLRISLVPQTENPFPQPRSLPRVRVQIADSPTTFKTFEINTSSTSFSSGNWVHVVVQSFDDGTAGKRRAELWINGSRYITEQYNYTDWTSTSADAVIFGSDYITTFGTPTASFSEVGIDEVAIYANALTNSQIINHYNFISTASPNVSYQVGSFDADVQSGDHQVIAIDNAIISETPATATTLFADPSILAVKNKSITADIMTASAQNTDVTIFYGWTIYAEPAIAYAERPEAYFLNDFYYQYVQTNIAPYRYVTFDAADGTLDYGTDADYAVIPTTIGGTVVNPDLGINGKSVKTTGSSYITDGVILRESVHDDDWGTSGNHYSSSFWIQRALDDTSTTGLRIIANAYGYGTGDYFLLYHYQNKLHFEFKNTTTVITQTTVNNINLFDYNRHLVVLDLDHTGQTDYAKIYVDATLVMTIDLGTNRVSLINGTPHTAPNDEANNLPRYSVGCLITPFAETSLPVVPANTKLIIDEVYWDKNSITQTQVTNLYNAMPDKNNKTIVVEAFIALDELVMPAFSTSSILATAPLTASASLLEPVTTPVRNIVLVADLLTATAMLADPRVFEDRIITADVFVVTAIFNNPGLVITIPGGPMLASIVLIDRPQPFTFPTNDFGISVSTNGLRYQINEFSSYIKYLRIVARNQKIYKDMEIL